MSKVLVVTGSVRPQSVNEKIVPVVVSALESRGQEVSLADVKELNLPFFDSAIVPSDPTYAPQSADVVRWTKMVDEADAVVLVTPEYNHTMTPVQLNAIDWIAKEWQDKPVALVGYGWGSGGAQAQATAREALAVNMKAKVGEKTTNLFFTKDIGMDGTIIDESSLNSQLSDTIDELLVNIG